MTLNQIIEPGSGTQAASEIAPAPAANLPADIAGGQGGTVPVPVAAPALKSARRRRIWVLLALAAVGLGAAGGGYYWWKQSLNRLPGGIVVGNGRIESDQIDIDTKFAGRVATLQVNEGDMVKAGQIVATMDIQDLEASLRRAEAQVLQSQQAITEARATQAQQETQVSLAQQQFDRTTTLVKNNNATVELLDQRRQQLDGAKAGLAAAVARVAQAEHALEAARQSVALYQVNIKDNTLTAPRDGRIQYRIANLGEVLPAGGRVLTMIDIQSVYMDIYLPTLDAGRVKVGTDGRIVLDAYPALAIPAQASFIATQSQFTPKTVETQTERDKLMFRVRVRIDPELLRAHADAVRTGLPGVAYLRLDPNVQWPERLQGEGVK